jgi:hypothetical protein
MYQKILTNLLRCRLISRHTRTNARAPRLEIPGLVFTNIQNLNHFRPDHRVGRDFGEVLFLQHRHAIEKIRIHSIWRDPRLLEGLIISSPKVGSVLKANFSGRAYFFRLPACASSNHVLGI